MTMGPFHRNQFTGFTLHACVASQPATCAILVGRQCVHFEPVEKARGGFYDILISQSFVAAAKQEYPVSSRVSLCTYIKCEL